VVSVYNTASAGIAMGILILPLIASMCEDALGAVPRSLRAAALSVSDYLAIRTDPSGDPA